MCSETLFERSESADPSRLDSDVNFERAGDTSSGSTNSSGSGGEDVNGGCAELLGDCAVGGSSFVPCGADGDDCNFNFSSSSSNRWVSIPE